MNSPRSCIHSLGWLAIGCAVAVSGCASGSWLESPSEAELPLDPPKRPYPTAVRASLSDDDSEEAPQQALPATQSAPIIEQAPPPQQQPPQQRAERPQTPVPSLAVLPPQFVQRPPQPAAPTLDAVIPTHTQSPLPAQALTTSRELSPPEIALPSAIDARALPAWLPPSALSAIAPTIAPASESAWQPAWQPASQAQVKSMPASASSVLDGSLNEPHPQLENARQDFLAALEAEIRERRSADPKDEELPRLEQELRLAHLACGHFDEAVAAVESLDEAQREAYKHLMFSLGVWLSPEESRRAPLRTAKVLRSLRDATTELAAASKLEVRNLAFCTDVDAFGWYREFPRNEFQPKQPVVLYVEVDNFAAEKKSPSAFETELQGSYQIFDSSGRIVAERQLEPDKAVCRNYRRDYFLRYVMYMPADIAPGRYRLELTIEDLKAKDKYQGRKLGEGMIEFTIRQ
jgi:hypothetical protein